VRASGRGNLPSRGWTGEGDWTGWVPFEEMPHALNPRQGFVVSCNQPIVPDGYPHFLGECFINGWRARRITDEILARPALGPDDCRAIQADVTCLPGREFVARLAGLSGGDPDADLALRLLRAWDGQLGPDSVGGCVYEVVRLRAVRRLVEPALGKDLADRLAGAGLDPLMAPTTEFHGHDTVTLLRLLDDPASAWVRDAGGRDEWLRGALREAVAWLRARLGPDPEGWRWGRIHRAVFVHPLAMRPPVDLVFNLGPFPLGGDRDTPNQTAMLPDRPYDALAWAPSFRQVCVPSDWSRSVSIHVPGQSGVPGSPHFDDLVEPWLRCEGHPMLWTAAEVEAQAAHRIGLLP